MFGFSVILSTENHKAREWGNEIHYWFPESKCTECTKPVSSGKKKEKKVWQVRNFFIQFLFGIQRKNSLLLREEKFSIFLDRDAAGIPLQTDEASTLVKTANNSF